MNDNRYTAEFPPELMEFIDGDPAVCATFHSMKHASDAVARHGSPAILIKLAPEAHQKDLQFLRPLPVG